MLCTDLLPRSSRLAALSFSPSPPPPRPRPRAARSCAFSGDVSPGTIVVRTNERRLYLVLGEGRALRYPVGVGRAGRQWAGRAFIDGKHVGRRGRRRPTSSASNPSLPDVIPGGSPNNPMGVAALTLSGGDYAIHGTNNPGSIGGFVSYGCIRMYNQDITDLYDRVSVGTPVIVTR